MSYRVSDLTKVISQKVISAVQNLLETKHLYQSVEISVKDFDQIIGEIIEELEDEIMRAGPNASSYTSVPTKRTEQLQQHRDSLLYSNWDFDPETNS